MRFYTYDLETMFNCFLFSGKFEDDPTIYCFEMSSRVNHRTELLQHLNYLQNLGDVYMVGFNSLQFDYPILHDLMNNPYTFDFTRAYHLAQQIITSYGDERGSGGVRLSDRIIPQIDLLKLNHLDNVMKRTRLKDLQFAMRSETIEDLPFPFDTNLSSEQMDQMRSYNAHDIVKTELFLKKCKHLISMRKELLDNGVLSGDVLNYSDVKIGIEYLVRKIGRHKCFINGSKPRQFFRQNVSIKEIILPKIEYRTEAFAAVKSWFEQQTIWMNKNERPAFETNLADLDFHFGVGGVHASVTNKAFHSNDEMVILDVDVSGMYVAVAIANGFAPEHLGRDFTLAYRQLQADRAQYPKGTTMNAVLKLAGNGVYGNSNNPCSCFYDPKYMFTVTVNGQLQVIQLVELLSLIPGLRLIQANTDGVTTYLPRAVVHLFNLWCNEWEALTGLKLEHVEYRDMWIRDVNNYIAVTKDGKVKRKGAYWYPTCEKDYDGVWNKDFSNMVVQKGVDMVMRLGYSPEDVVRVFADPYDFTIRYKTNSGSKLYLGDAEMPKTLRYYVSKTGQPLKKVVKPKGELGAWKRRNGIADDFYEKVMKEIPTGAWDERIHTKNKSKYAPTVSSIESGWLVKECNNINKFNWSDVDYDYYVAEIKKLIIGAN